MKIKIGSKPLGNDYLNEIIVKIKGYFGDGDSYFNEEESFGLGDPNLECYLVMCEALLSRDLETIDEMKEYLKDKGYDSDKISIPYDPYSYDMLPCEIDVLDVYYYNDKGQKFSVTYEE